jgi:hypothetical protein
MAPHCTRPNTNDPECQRSVFEASGCLSAGYGTRYCTGQSPVVPIPTTSQPQSLIPAVYETAEPTQEDTPRPRELPPRETESPKETQDPNAVCNCVGCQFTTQIPGSASYCRCCRNALNSCKNNALCSRSVFTATGCIAANWEEKCSVNKRNALITTNESAELTDTYNVALNQNLAWIILLVVCIMLMIIAAVAVIMVFIYHKKNTQVIV